MSKEQEMNSLQLAGDMVREIGSYLNAKDFKSLRHTCTFFARQTYDELVKRVQAQQTVTDIKMGTDTVLLLKQDGTVWFSGSNPRRDCTDRMQFTPIPNLNNVCQISVGDTNYFYLKKDGSLWAQGLNDQGQLGLGEKICIREPERIPNFENVCQIATYAYHTLFLKKDGSVWVCGRNEEGQLGLGHNKKQSIPIKIPELSNICQIAAGKYHSLFLRKDGLVQGCGLTGDGQLGLGYIGRINIPTFVPGVSDIAQVSAGYSHSLLLKKDGMVFGMGNSYFHFPTTIDVENVSQVAAGYMRSLLLKNDGSIKILEYKLDNTNLPDSLNCTDIANIYFAHHHVFLQKMNGSILALMENKQQIGFGEYAFFTYTGQFILSELCLVTPEHDVEALKKYHAETESNRMQL